MFDKESIQLLQESASITAANVEITANDVAALPSDFKLHDLEQYMPQRRRARGVMTTRFIKQFGGYVQQHAELGTAIFIDAGDMTASAVLNLGTPGKPGHADNLAALALKRTAAYAALKRITETARNQTEVAEFLEDWPEHLTCFNDQGEIKRPLAIAAVRKITIDSSRKLESEEQQLGATRSAFESVQASSKDPLPTTIYFKCLPYSDLQSRIFVLRLGILTGDSKPKLTLRIQKEELHSEEMATELATLLETEFAGTEDATVIPVLVGSYSKRQ